MPALPDVVRYRKKPVVVETLEWTGRNLAAIQVFCGYFFEVEEPKVRIGSGEDLEVWNDQEIAWIPCPLHHRVVRGVLGELYPISPAALAKTFEPAGAADSQDGTSLIAAERQRQVTEEGWTAEHDAEHAKGELARAAACYALPPDRRQIATARHPADRTSRFEPWPLGWPWHPSWWKPAPDDRVRELVKAAALIAAEIDRLQAAAGDAR
jgi:hypothetical protein